MQRSELKQQIDRVIWTARINQRYYQIIAWRHAMIDRSIRLLVGFLSLTSIPFSMEHSPTFGWWPLGVSLAGAIFAVTLIVLPVGEWEKFNTSLYQRWSLLRGRSESMAIALENGARQNTDAAELESYNELLSEKTAIDAAETKCHEGVFKKCEGDINYAMFGARTYEERVEQLQKLKPTG